MIIVRFLLPEAIEKGPISISSIEGLRCEPGISPTFAFSGLAVVED